MFNRFEKFKTWLKEFCEENDFYSEIRTTDTPHKYDLTIANKDKIYWCSYYEFSLFFPFSRHYDGLFGLTANQVKDELHEFFFPKPIEKEVFGKVENGYQWSIPKPPPQPSSGTKNK